MTENQLTLSVLPDVLVEIEQAFWDIPFENSDYQNRTFVVAAQQTGARAYRAIGLRMFAKVRAIKELGFNRQLEQVDIDEKQSVIDDVNASEFSKRRARIEIEKLIDQRRWADKLLNDALRELNCLYMEYKKLPNYTRGQFEAEEQGHFKLVLERKIKSGGNGALESLANMNLDTATLAAMLNSPNELETMLKETQS